MVDDTQKPNTVEQAKAVLEVANRHCADLNDYYETAPKSNHPTREKYLNLLLDARKTRDALATAIEDLGFCAKTLSRVRDERDKAISHMEEALSAQFQAEQENERLRKAVECLPAEDAMETARNIEIIVHGTHGINRVVQADQLREYATALEAEGK